MARVVVPKMPHHVTQRGNRRQETFLRKTDYAEYVRLMAEWCGKYESESFLEDLENRLGVTLRKMKPGPKPSKRKRRR